MMQANCETSRDTMLTPNIILKSTQKYIYSMCAKIVRRTSPIAGVSPRSNSRAVMVTHELHVQTSIILLLHTNVMLANLSLPLSFNCILQFAFKN